MERLDAWFKTKSIIHTEVFEYQRTLKYNFYGNMRKSIVVRFFVFSHSYLVLTLHYYNLLAYLLYNRDIYRYYRP